MSGSTSRRKGKRGERELAAALTAEGFDARRGAQHRGGPDSPDVLCGDLPRLHFEVKRCERLHLYSSVEQAQREAGDDQLPVVCHRRNHHDWVAILPLETLLAIVRESNLPATSGPEPTDAPTEMELHDDAV